jgi:hypothetical protein
LKIQAPGFPVRGGFLKPAEGTSEEFQLKK